MMNAKTTSQVLGIITARGGSKGLPNKNVLPLAGKPLIAHSIDAALNAQHLDRIIVSTDNHDIADTAREFGVEVPFIRPPELAEDTTLAYPVLVHAARWLIDQEGYRPDYVMLLQPTSPLRTSADIDGAIELALDNDADSVVSLCGVKHHPYWIKSVSDDKRISDFMTLDKKLETAYSRRQDLPQASAINGAIYLVRLEVLMEQETFYTDRTFAYLMPIDRSIDIDTAFDLFLAEATLRNWNFS